MSLFSSRARRCVSSARVGSPLMLSPPLRRSPVSPGALSRGGGASPGVSLFSGAAILLLVGCLVRSYPLWRFRLARFWCRLGARLDARLWRLRWQGYLLPRFGCACRSRRGRKWS